MSLRQDNYKNIIPIAHSLKEAITYLKGLYGIAKGTFTAYHFDLNVKAVPSCKFS